MDFSLKNIKHMKFIIGVKKDIHSLQCLQVKLDKIDTILKDIYKDIDYINYLLYNYNLIKLPKKQ